MPVESCSSKHIHSLRCLYQCLPFPATQEVSIMSDVFFMSLFGFLAFVLLGWGFYAGVQLNKDRKDVQKNDR
ncbi:hypothetical protein GCM10009425_28500 [Pseudomonas asuensis]|nr:hypothetical protein GCM10009425_28500 [Pseudomonas asuensis]